MPGIDRNRVIGKDSEELDEFTCGICHEVFVNPMSTPCCRQTYCKKCIDEWLTEHNTCPNDRTELTSDGLLQSARIVLNLIDKMQIRCAYSEKGCPSVHTIGQDTEHLKVCEFARCGQCGLEDPEPNHSCVTHLLDVNLDLCEDNRKLKTLNKDLRKEFKKLKTDLDVKSKEWFERESQLKAIAIQLERELALVRAITAAKDEECIVEEKFDLWSHQSWENIVINNCKNVIESFSAGKHSSKQFADMIKAKMDKVSKCWHICYSWSVSIYANVLPANWEPIDDFLRLSFGKLIIVVKPII